MTRKLLNPLIVAAINGSVVLVTLPAEATVEFEPVPDNGLADDDLTELMCYGEIYVARSQDLLDAAEPSVSVES